MSVLIFSLVGASPCASCGIMSLGRFASCGIVSLGWLPGICYPVMVIWVRLALCLCPKPPTHLVGVDPTHSHSWWVSSHSWCGIGSAADLKKIEVVGATSRAPTIIWWEGGCLRGTENYLVGGGCLHGHRKLFSGGRLRGHQKLFGASTCEGTENYLVWGACEGTDKYVVGVPSKLFVSVSHNLFMSGPCECAERIICKRVERFICERTKKNLFVSE